jgi:hypothetical protein
MNRRSHLSCVTGAVVAIALACLQSAVAGQQAAARPAQAGAPRPSGPPPRLNGRPSLAGVWNFSTATPFERPVELGDKAFLTPEEAAKYSREVTASRSLDRRDGSKQADIGRAYNDFWADWGTQVVGTLRTSLIVDPPDGRLPPLIAEAQAREASRQAVARRPPEGPEDRSLAERCLIGFNAGPPMITGPYNNHVQLLQTDDYLVILNEMNHNARIVPLTARPWVAGSVPQWAGISRGRWEGDTLVVETRNFTKLGTGNITLRVAMSDRMQLVERFTRVDGGTLMYKFTVTDPGTWTQPWTVELPLRLTNDRIYEYACHEGNYGMAGMLRGARADEQAGNAR